MIPHLRKLLDEATPWEQNLKWRELADAPFTEDELALMKSWNAFQDARYKAAETHGYATSPASFVAGLRLGLTALRSELEGCDDTD